ncbi:hypothetical protein CSB37_00840 [bacterium DOLZORAL124_38_8]|nr:MAG: hypothetical protein CSB37_00840 [bacterium DOLZORAL124_38_8]
MNKVKCALSGETFEVSDLEQELRAKFGFGASLPMIKPKYRFRQLGSFWPHWNLHSRKCDRTGKPIISIFRPECEYPVWQRSVWLEENNPSQADFDFTQPFFDQAWALFKQCPIPHRTGNKNENCEYTDDCWYSKNCYLAHSIYKSEDAQYCYRSLVRDSQGSIFSINSELCNDDINCYDCFDSKYVLNCRKVQNSAFLYDCRNCTDCMFCFNLRNKQYCFGNKQLTQSEYETKIAAWNLSSQKSYTKAKKFFADMMTNLAFHRAQSIDKSEDCTGNYQSENNKAENIYFSQQITDSVNAIRAYESSHYLDTIGCTIGERNYYSTTCQFSTYDNFFSFACTECQFIDYCAYCFQCENCFGCCGLVGKKYCIFNKPYSEDEYFALKDKIIAHMKQAGEWGQFFPGHFAPNPYNESWSSFYWPLSNSEQETLGFRTCEPLHREPVKTAEITEIPDTVDELTEERTEWLLQQIFWDESYRRPFQITKHDITFAKKLKVPLPHSFYMARIQENFRWLPFDGELRDGTCGKCQKSIQTSWPTKYDRRILCEACYLNLVA